MLLLGASCQSRTGRDRDDLHSRGRPEIDTVVSLWSAALLAITARGALPLFSIRLDLSKLTFSTPIPVVVGIGLKITAFASTPSTKSLTTRSGVRIVFG